MLDKKKTNKLTMVDKLVNKKMVGDQIVLADDVSSRNSELFNLKSYFEVIIQIVTNCTPLIIGALIEVFTETIAAFEIIRNSKANNTFQATTAFGLCLVFTHLFHQPFVSSTNHFINYKLKMFVGVGDHSDAHLCLWWMRNKSLKYAFWGGIVPSTFLFGTVGTILHYGMSNPSGANTQTDREKLIT